jgi:hypothetical protein
MRLAVITPSYAPDYELCSDLHRSVLRCTPSDVDHYIVVPDSDLDLFASLRGPRARILPVSAVLPRRVLSVPGVNFWINLRRPLPPIRGWMMQQIVKLQTPSYVDADVLLFADSDVLLVRSVDIDTFRHDGRVVLYRKENGVDEQLPRHVVWHDVARSLLGAPAGSPPFPDYISALNVWDRSIVCALQDRIQEITGRPWIEAVGSQLHFSEYILYGVFVDHVMGAPHNGSPIDSMRCHDYWKTEPLDPDKARDFVAGVRPEDVAIMISAKSRTPLEVRRQAISAMQPGPMIRHS